jgi:DNA polymerase alpha/epsilon subunit B/DNA polymerase delta subunit OB-fold domain
MVLEAGKEYVVSEKDVYERGYSSMYESRLSLIEEIVHKRFGSLHGSKKEGLVVGIVYVKSKKKVGIIEKPGGVREIGEDAESYCSEENEYFLENREVGAIRLVLEKGRHVLINGSVVGVIGDLSDGVLSAEQILLPSECSEARKRPKRAKSQIGGGVLILGGAVEAKSGLSLFEVAGKEIAGKCGASGIIVLEDGTRSEDRGRNSGKAEKELVRIAGSLKDSKLFLVPGRGDLVPRMLPLQPMSQNCLGPEVHATTNPVLFHLKGPGKASIQMSILVVPSYSLVDMLKYFPPLSGETYLDGLEMLLSLRHIAPTAPDTLDAYPVESDLFVLEEIPDVLVAGNLGDALLSRRVECEGKEVLLLVLPPFHDSGQGVLVDVLGMRVVSLSME